MHCKPDMTALKSFLQNKPMLDIGDVKPSVKTLIFAWLCITSQLSSSETALVKIHLLRIMVS